MIEKNPRQGVELREALACIGSYWLLGAMAVAFVTLDARPLCLSLAIALLLLWTPKAGARGATSRRRQRRMTRAGITAAVLVGWAAFFFWSRS